MGEQPVNLRDWIPALRRRWVVIVLAVLVGVAGALVVTIAIPSLSSAKALVLLPPSSLGANGQPSRDIATETQIVMSPGILDPAGERLHPPMGFTTLQHRVAAVGLTSDILQITAKARTSHEAEELADNVAQEFVNYTTRESISLSGVILSLQEEATELQRQVTDLQGEIGNTAAAVTAQAPTSPQGRSDASLLTSLEALQQTTTLQLDGVNSQIAQTKLDESNVGTGTVILERATTAVVPSPWRPLIFALIGALAGVLLGAMVALLVDRRDRRLRYRDQIAEVVGAPVVGSVSMRPPGGTQAWIDLLARWEPGVDDAWSMRKMLHRLAEGSPKREVAVVSLAGDEAALALGPQLAASAATIGIPSSFVDATDHESASDLRQASVVLAAEPQPTRANLQIGVRDGTPEPESEFTVSAVVLDPRDPDWRLTTRPGSTWLALSAGYATAEDLTRVSLVAAESERPIRGIVVVNPDRMDSTFGRHPAQTPRAEALAPRRTLGPVKDAIR